VAFPKPSRLVGTLRWDRIDVEVGDATLSVCVAGMLTTGDVVTCDVITCDVITCDGRTGWVV
jgi:hypothetical protein